MRLFRWMVFVTLSCSIAFATADGPDYYDVQGLQPGQALCLHTEANASSPALGCVPADALCLKNLGIHPEGDMLPPGTQVWKKVYYKDGNLTGWGMGQWLGEAGSSCSTPTIEMTSAAKK